MFPWHLLGLDGPTSDPVAIKRAYAKRLRVTRPDDDADAYQALRRAYDHALALAAGAGPADGAPAPAEERAAPPVPAEPAPHAGEDPGPTPASLCAAFAAAADREAVLSRAHLDALLSALDALPLASRDEASVRFADAVIQRAGLPDGVKRALRDHFQWTGDFRQERLMGPARLAALGAVLPEEVTPERDPAVLAQFSDFLAVQALLNAGRVWTARVATVLLDARLRSQMQTIRVLLRLTTDGRLSAQGRRLLAALAPEGVLGPVRTMLSTSHTVRAVLFVALLAATVPFFGEAPLAAAGAAGLAGGLALAATLVTIAAADWAMRQRARFAPEAPGLPAWVPRFDQYKGHRVGIWLLIGASIALPRLADRSGDIADGLLLAYLVVIAAGLFLAQSGDVAETVTTVAVIGFVSVTLDLLPHAVEGRLALWPSTWIPVLFAWFFGNVTTGANGGYAAACWNFRERPRLGLGAGLLMSSVPAAVGWAHAHCGFVVMVAGSVLAGGVALRLQAAGMPAWFTLGALPVVLCAAWLLRTLTQAAGRRLLVAARR